MITPRVALISYLPSDKIMKNDNDVFYQVDDVYHIYVVLIFFGLNVFKHLLIRLNIQVIFAS